MNVRMLFRGLLFYVGLILFLSSSLLLFIEIKDLFEEGIVGAISIEASDSQIQLRILKNGFVTLIFIGLEIISLLIMSYFKDWDKEEINN